MSSLVNKLILRHLFRNLFAIREKKEAPKAEIRFDLREPVAVATFFHLPV